MSATEDGVGNGDSTAIIERKQNERRREVARVQDDSIFANLLDTNKYEHMYRVAQMYAQTQFVPECFRGKPADCFIACQMAVRLGLDPMMLMQRMYIVHGKPGMEAQLVIALINANGPFTGPLQFRYEGEGMSRRCVAFATHSRTRQVCEREMSMQVAKAEGWIDKSGSKWKTMPDQMLAYRAAAWFARLYCPEVLLGLATTEEIEDTKIIDVPARTITSLAKSIEQLPQTQSPPQIESAEHPEPDAEPVAEQPIDASPAPGSYAAWLIGVGELHAELGGTPERLAKTMDSLLKRAGKFGKEESTTPEWRKSIVDAVQGKTGAFSYLAD